jgi:hypothetical protein
MSATLNPTLLAQWRVIVNDGKGGIADQRIVEAPDVSTAVATARNERGWRATELHCERLSGWDGSDMP